MNPASCLVCKLPFVEGNFQVESYSTNHKKSEAPLRILICKRCGHGIADPMLSDETLETLYNKSSYWEKTPKRKITKRRFPVLFALAKARWDVIKPHFKDMGATPITILDIGAGHGCFGLTGSGIPALTMKSYTAVEPDPAMRASLMDTWAELQNNIELKVYDDLDKVNGKFDLIVLSNVLEHVVSPEVLIKETLGFQKEDGLIFIDVPHQDQKFKPDVFPHLQFFSAESLTLLIKNIQLELITVGTWGRSWEETPMRMDAKHLLITKFFGRFTAILPGAVSAVFYAWYFGVNNPHPRGTWIRALVRN